MRIPIAAIILCLVASPAVAAKKRVRRSPMRQELRVAPSDGIEARVQAEIDKADAILRQLDAVTLFDSPYVISALYYRDGYLSQYPEGKADADPARRIISHISRLLTPELKKSFIGLLHELYDEQHPLNRPAFVAPVRLAAPNKRRLRRTHPHAVDLFTPEGSPVLAASAGVVLLAENHWNEADPFSTSSHAGGNTIIIFDPASNRFYRYCHLESVEVIPGEVVEPGARLGLVGHSGLNASRDGHGRHLHFEINEYDGNAIRPLTYKEIWAMLMRT
jgi:murein DD-endopeptidase MepM/ murein hydrolase activator NlpD